MFDNAKECCKDYKNQDEKIWLEKKRIKATSTHQSLGMARHTNDHFLF